MTNYVWMRVDYPKSNMGIHGLYLLINGLRIILPKRKVGIFEMFPRNLNDKGYYLFENEKSLYEAQKSGYRCGCIPSDATLISMHRQWFDRGKPRIKPKPIIEQLKLLINSLSLEMLKVN